MGLDRKNLFTKFSVPVGDSSVLTFTAMYNTLHQNVSLGYPYDQRSGRLHRRQYPAVLNRAGAFVLRDRQHSVLKPARCPAVRRDGASIIVTGVLDWIFPSYHDHQRVRRHCLYHGDAARDRPDGEHRAKLVPAHGDPPWRTGTPPAVAGMHDLAPSALEELAAVSRNSPQVAFTLRDGRVGDVALARGTGFPGLDRAMLAAVHDAFYPRPPVQAEGRDMRFLVCVQFEPPPDE
jgi:hypothetical protein